MTIESISTQFNELNDKIKIKCQKIKKIKSIKKNDLID